MIWEILVKLGLEKAGEKILGWVAGKEKLVDLQNEIHANRELLRQRAVAALAACQNIEPMHHYTISYSKTIYDKQEYRVGKKLRGEITGLYAKLRQLEDLGKQLQDRLTEESFHEYVCRIGDCFVDIVGVEEQLARKTKLPADLEQDRRDRELGVQCELLPGKASLAEERRDTK